MAITRSISVGEERLAVFQTSQKMYSVNYKTIIRLLKNSSQNFLITLNNKKISKTEAIEFMEYYGSPWITNVHFGKNAIIYKTYSKATLVIQPRRQMRLEPELPKRTRLASNA